MKSCEECKFYQPPRGIQDLGRCRYNPPSLSGEWPTVYTDDWCGKWDVPQPVETSDHREFLAWNDTDTEPFEDRVYADAFGFDDPAAMTDSRDSAGV